MLRAVVIILGVLIVIAFMALVIGGVMKFRGRSTSLPVAAANATLPPGARIMSVETSGDRVIVALHAPDGDEVDIFDAENGHTIARIRAAPPDVPK